MAGEPVTTLVGNLTADPELRFTPSGDPVANFTVACTPRTYNRQNDQWDDGETMFVRCAVWRSVAENVAGSLQKGHRVVVLGRLKVSAYTDRDGNARTSIEMDVDELGPSLRYGMTSFEKAQQGSGGGRQQGGRQQARAPQGQQRPPQQGGYQQDPWAGSAPPQGGWAPPAGGYDGRRQGPPPQQQQRGPAPDPWAAGQSDEPPF